MKQNETSILPKWILPSAILIFLILALAFRWSTGPSKTISNYLIMAYSHDNWTNQYWLKTYIFSRYEPRIIEQAVPKENIKHPYLLRNSLTIGWLIIFSIVAIWLLRSFGLLRWLKKQKLLPRSIPPWILPAFVMFLIVFIFGILSSVADPFLFFIFFSLALIWLISSIFLNKKSDEKSED